MLCRHTILQSIQTAAAPSCTPKAIKPPKKLEFEQKREHKALESKSFGESRLHATGSGFRGLTSPALRVCPVLLCLSALSPGPVPSSSFSSSPPPSPAVALSSLAVCAADQLVLIRAVLGREQGEAGEGQAAPSPLWLPPSGAALGWGLLNEGGHLPHTPFWDASEERGV